MPVSKTMNLAHLMANYKPGDEWSWGEEIDYLHKIHRHKLLRLYGTIKRNGMKQPILLGNDGRVWDGHHRILVARMLFLKEVPVEFA